MGPKKFLTSSTPAVTKPSHTFAISSDVSAPSTITELSSQSSFGIGTAVVEAPVKQLAVSKMSTMDLVVQAIETIGAPRKGASYIAIQKWIASCLFSDTKENVVVNRLKANLKKAIVKALENGLLKRPLASKNVTGLRGFFMLNKDAIKQAEKKTAKKLVEKAKAIKVAKTKTVAAKETKTLPPPKGKTAVAPKTKTAAVPKTKTAAAPKTKTAAAPMTKTAAAPKTKAIVAPKTKAAVAPKPKATVAPMPKVAVAPKTKAATAPKNKAAAQPKEDAVEATKPKLKTKAAGSKLDDIEAGPSNEPKVKRKTKAAVKPKPGQSPVPKTKPKPAAASKPKLQKANSKDNPKAEKARGNEVKFSEEDLPTKVPKQTSKATKDTRTRRLYNADSDTELAVKPDPRKSMKSYASDTELDVTYNRKKPAKAAKVTKKLAKKESSKTGPSVMKPKTRRISYADDVFDS